MLASADLRGLRPVNSDVYRNLCDYVFWCNDEPRENAGFRNGDVVFCKIDEVWRIFRALRRTRKRIVLVTGDGCRPATESLWSQKPPHISHWFGLNMFARAADTTPLPLGLGREGHDGTLDWRDILSAFADPPARSRMLYANFGVWTNPSVRGPLASWLHEAEQRWIETAEHTPGSGMKSYLASLLAHHFVYCPPGAGEDTHRMWEALYCGAIPIVRESPAMRDFKDLPVLFVERLDGISEDFLRTALGRWSQTRFSLEKLNADYWEKRFAQARDEVRRRGRVTLREWLMSWFDECRRVAKSRCQHLFET